MKALFERPTFVTLGPDLLHAPTQPPPTFQVDGATPRELRREIRKACSQRPGVYAMIDANGDLLYVGKAKRLRTRLLSYFRKRGRDPKARRIIQRTVRIIWEPAPSEFAALLRELELIQRWQPRGNVQGRPGLRFRSYLCLGRGPAPYIFLTRNPSPKLFKRTRGMGVSPVLRPVNCGTGVSPVPHGCFGPVFGGKRARAAIQCLNDLFHLRDCPSEQTMVFAGQQGLFPQPLQAGCIRLELGTCLGPCAAACSQSAYGRKAHGALAFLRGDDLSLLDRLQGEMLEAASVRHFERAARRRDQLELLRGLREQLDRLHRWQDRMDFVYPVTGAEGEVWYLIHRGRVRSAWLRGDAAGRPRFLEQLRTALRDRSPGEHSIPANEIDSLLLLAAWFRRYPEELKRTVAVREAMRAAHRDKSLQKRTPR